MDIADAVVPLVSALIGGVISGATVFMQIRHDAKLERQRRDHEAQIALAAKREQAADEARAAARILQADIQLAKARIGPQPQFVILTGRALVRLAFHRRSRRLGLLA